MDDPSPKAFGRSRHDDGPPQYYGNEDDQQERVDSDTSDSELEGSDEDVCELTSDFSQHPAPELKGVPPLSKPIAIPQVHSRLMSPFSRAYSDTLGPHGVTEEEFLQFIDNLNVVSSANPPLEVLDLVGNIVGSIPHESTLIAGLAVNTAANIGTYILSKTRGDKYMALANKQYFEPRRLRARVYTSKALLKLLDLPVASPLVATLDDTNENVGVLQSRMAALGNRVASLKFEVTAPAQQKALLARVSAWQVERQAKAQEKKRSKKRTKYRQKESKAEGKMVGLEAELASLRSQLAATSQWNGQRENRKALRDLEKLDRDRGRMEEKHRKRQRKRDKGADIAKKAKWIVIESIEHPLVMEREVAVLQQGPLPSVNW